MIMTSNEFSRRVQFYNSLEQACSFFTQIPLLDLIFKFDVSWVDSRSCIYNTIPVISFDNSSSVVFYTCERFTKADFLCQFKYFKSFIRRLSKSQLESLCNSGVLSSLLSYNDFEALRFCGLDNFNSMKNTAVQDA